MAFVGAFAVQWGWAGCSICCGRDGRGAVVAGGVHDLLAARVASFVPLAPRRAHKPWQDG